MLMFYLAMIDGDEDKSKFELIYENYRKQMYYVAFKVLNDTQWAEDATQDAFIKIINLLPKIDDVMRNETRRYILLTAESAAIDVYRKHFKKQLDKVSFEDLSVDIPAKSMDFSETNELATLIDKLSPNYAVVIKYTYVHGLSTKELSKILSISEDNVRKRLECARKALDKLRKETKIENDSRVSI